MRDLSASTPLEQPATGPVPGATLVVEAPTAEQALTDLHGKLGADARIIEVRRVSRGGIGGFFAREMVELHAAPGERTTATPPAGAAPAAATAPAGAAAPAPAGAAAPPAPMASAGDPAGAAVPAASSAGEALSPVARLLEAEAAGEAAVPDEVDFATFLRQQLTEAPARTAAPSTHEALLERATAVARDAVRAASGIDAGGVVDPTLDRVAPAAAAAPAAPAAPAAATAATAPAVSAPTAAAPRTAAAVAAATYGAAGAGGYDPVAVLTAPEPVVGGPAVGAASLEAPAAVATLEAAPAAVGSEPVATLSTELTEPAAASEPGPAWSVAALVKLGLPTALVRGLEVAEPADDVAWTAALAGALRPVCRPLPTGRSLMVGPCARSVASGLGVTTTAVGQPIRSRAATVAAAAGSGAASQRWLEKVRGNRWIHVVVGGTGWRDLLHLDPLAVSWSSEEDVPEAIRLAVELGLVLGAGPIGREVQRARPLDVALAVRSLLPTVPAAGAGR